VQSGESGNVGRENRDERQAKIEMQRLEVAAGCSAGRRDDEVSDDLEGRLTVRRGVDDTARFAPRLVDPGERTRDPHDGLVGHV
jgi:hypothetical protein